MENIRGQDKGKIGVLIEEHFDPLEYQGFTTYFPQQGYQIEYLSHLWNLSSLTFHSNPVGTAVEYQVDVFKEINDVQLSDFKGIILIGAYAMDRLRYESHPQKGWPNQSPGVQFLRRALKVPGLKIGTICHALWLFCADPSLLKGRKVTCAHNIICDVTNAGGEVQFEGDQVASLVIDGDLISAKHPDALEEFMSTFIREIEKNNLPIKPEQS